MYAQRYDARYYVVFFVYCILYNDKAKILNSIRDCKQSLLPVHMNLVTTMCLQGMYPQAILSYFVVLVKSIVISNK